MPLQKLLASICLFLTGLSCIAAESVRDLEIQECRPGEISTWSDGTDRAAAVSSLLIAYRHDDAPAWFDSRQVQELLARAAREWSKCGIPISVVALGIPDGDRQQTLRVQWSEKESLGNFGLANLTRRTLSLGPQAFALLRSRNPSHDATQTLQMVISHEMGHFLGLMAHSRRCIDVLSYYHDGKGAKCFSRDLSGVNAVVEYRHTLPTACDIQRCRIANVFPVAPGN